MPWKQLGVLASLGVPAMLAALGVPVMLAAHGRPSALAVSAMVALVKPAARGLPGAFVENAPGCACGAGGAWAAWCAWYARMPRLCLLCFAARGTPAAPGCVVAVVCLVAHGSPGAFVERAMELPNMLVARGLPSVPGMPLALAVLVMLCGAWALQAGCRPDRQKVALPSRERGPWRTCMCCNARIASCCMWRAAMTLPSVLRLLGDQAFDVEVAALLPGLGPWLHAVQQHLRAPVKGCWYAAPLPVVLGAIVASMEQAAGPAAPAGPEGGEEVMEICEGRIARQGW